MITRELINRSWYLSGIVSRGLETVGGELGEDGLYLLNEIIVEKSSTGRFIPAYRRETFAGVVGQEEYFVPDLVQLETLTVTLQQFRFQMYNLNRTAYFGMSKALGINSLPVYYYYERLIDPTTKNQGSNIFVWYRPSQDNYIFEVTGRFNLAKVTFDTVISDMLQDFYISYLSYKLAHRMCQYYDVEFSPDKLNTLNQLEAQVDDVNPIDTTIQKISRFPSHTSINYAIANLSNGFIPG